MTRYDGDKSDPTLPAIILRWELAKKKRRRDHLDRAQGNPRAPPLQSTVAQSTHPRDSVRVVDEGSLRAAVSVGTRKDTKATHSALNEVIRTLPGSRASIFNDAAFGPPTITFLRGGWWESRQQPGPHRAQLVRGRQCWYSARVKPVRLTAVWRRLVVSTSWMGRERRF